MSKLGGGMIEGMKSKYAVPALMQVGGSMMQGAAADKKAGDERKRYNTNVGTRLW